MAQRRPVAEWQQLFAEYEASGQTKTAFCKAHGLSAQYFAKKYRAQTSGFAKVSVKPAIATTASPITLQMGDVIVRCDTHASTAWLAELAAALR